MNTSLLRMPVGVYVSVVMAVLALAIWPAGLREVARAGKSSALSAAEPSSLSMKYVQSPASEARAAGVAAQLNTVFTTIKATPVPGGRVKLIAAQANEYSAWLAAVGWLSLTSDSRSVVRTNSICVNDCPGGFAVAEFELIEFRFSRSR